MFSSLISWNLLSLFKGKYQITKPMVAAKAITAMTIPLAAPDERELDSSSTSHSLLEIKWRKLLNLLQSFPSWLKEERLPSKFNLIAFEFDNRSWKIFGRLVETELKLFKFNVSSTSQKYNMTEKPEKKIWNLREIFLEAKYEFFPSEIETA